MPVTWLFIDICFILKWSVLTIIMIEINYRAFQMQDMLIIRFCLDLHRIIMETAVCGYLLNTWGRRVSCLLFAQNRVTSGIFLTSSRMIKILPTTTLADIMVKASIQQLPSEKKTVSLLSLKGAIAGVSHCVQYRKSSSIPYLCRDLIAFKKILLGIRCVRTE